MPLRERSARTLIGDRKISHLELCDSAPVEYASKSTLFEEVDLIHNALPEIALEEIDLGVDFVGRRLRAPLLITGMTGGTEEAFEVNRALATVAERSGIAFGLGSQRVMQRDPSTAWTFEVRQFAPSVPLLANLGLTQVVQQSTADVQRLVDAVGADALCVHLNAAQELIQPEGDRDFRGGYAALRRLVGELSVPVIAKETGCGISRAVGLRLRRAGIRHVDVSGAGGTSWVKVESLRGADRDRRRGELFAEWGVPTAASLSMLRETGLFLIASGGLRTGLEIAKAAALGAGVCGAALPVYRAYRHSGVEGAADLIEDLIDGLRTAMLLTGARTIAELQRQPVVIGPRLRAWVEAASARTRTRRGGGEKRARRKGAAQEGAR